MFYYKNSEGFLYTSSIPLKDQNLMEITVEEFKAIVDAATTEQDPIEALLAGDTVVIK